MDGEVMIELELYCGMDGGGGLLMIVVEWFLVGEWVWVVVGIEMNL